MCSRSWWTLFPVLLLNLPIFAAETGNVGLIKSKQRDQPRDRRLYLPRNYGCGLAKG